MIPPQLITMIASTKVPPRSATTMKLVDAMVWIMALMSVPLSAAIGLSFSYPNSTILMEIAIVSATIMVCAYIVAVVFFYTGP